jgi:hypothetical protein
VHSSQLGAQPVRPIDLAAFYVNLEDAVSLYWSERDKATVIAFIGGETPSSWKRNPIKYWAAK